MARLQLTRGQKWFTTVALCAGLAAGTIGTAVAQQAPASPQPPQQRQQLLTPEDRSAMQQIFWHRMQERLGLSDQQVADIRNELQTRRAAARGDMQALFAARKQLRTLMQQPNASQADVQAAATQVKQLQDKLFDSRLQTQLAIRAKLTPEQLAKWTELRKGMGHRMRHHGRGFAPMAF